VPGLALAATPVTLLFGPSVAYNLAGVALPAAAAWTAYLLCRDVTSSVPASLVGGYLFGFSSFMVAHERSGHLNLTSTFLMPLLALVIFRAVRGELSRRSAAVRLGVILALQFSFSTEATATVTISLVVALVLAFALVRGARQRILNVLPAIAFGYVIAAALAAPLLYYAVRGMHADTIVFSSSFGTDLLNLVVPTRVTALGGSLFTSITSHFPADDAERDSYLGLPALAIIALVALQRPRSPGSRFLLFAFAAAVFLSLGTALYVGNRRIVSLPWSLWSGWIGVEQIIPARFALYASLAAAVLVASWVARGAGGRAKRYGLALLAALALIPPAWGAQFADHPQRWPFFTHRLYRLCIPRDQTLMVFPFGRWGDSLLWQAESGFWFRIAEGTLAHTEEPRDFVNDPTIHELLFDYPVKRPSMGAIRALALRRHVDRIASVVQNDPYPDGAEMETFGQVQNLGGVAVAPACGYPSLTGDRRKP
jgi:hypothetical protein